MRNPFKHSAKSLVWIAALFLVFAGGCSDEGVGSPGGGLLDDVVGDMEGMSPIPQPGFPINEKLRGLGTLRLTNTAIQFLENHGTDIIMGALGDSLVIDDLEYDVPVLGTLKLNQPLTINLNSIHIDLTPSDILMVTITADPLFVDAAIGECLYTVRTNNDLSIPVQVQLKIDQYSYRMYPEVTVLDIPLNDVDIEYAGCTGNWLECAGCWVEGGLVGLAGNLLPAISGIIQTPVKNLIDEQLEQMLCGRCEADTDCRTLHGYTCKDNNICRLGDGTCDWMLIGLEQAFDLGPMLEGFMPGLAAELWFSLAAGYRVDIPQDESYMDLNLFGGTTLPCRLCPGGSDDECGTDYRCFNYVCRSSPTDLCELDPAKSDPCVDPMFFGGNPDLPRTDIGRTVPGTGEAYMVGIALREELLDQLGYTLYDSSLLCMTLDSTMPSVGEYLSLIWTFYGGVGQLVPDLPDGSPPAAIQLQPSPPIDDSNPIEFTLGLNEWHYEDAEGTNYGHQCPESDDEDFACTAKVDEPLIRLDINGLQLHMYAMVDERWYRAFTLKMDIGLPIAIDLTDGMLLPVIDIGALEINNITAPYSALDLNLERTAENLGGLLGAVMPMVSGLVPAMEPMEIPMRFDFDQDGTTDIALIINALKGIDPKNDLETEFAALGIYASMEVPSNARTIEQTTVVDTEIVEIVRRTNPGPDELREGKWPSLVLRVDGTDLDFDNDNLEFQYRIGNSAWSLWVPSRLLYIENPLLAAQGEHTIYVRARDRRDGRSWDRLPAEITVRTDWTAPQVRIVQDDGVVRFDVSDNTSASSSIVTRWRLEGEESWRETDHVNLDQLTLPATLEVSATDESGNETLETKVVKEKLPREILQTGQQTQDILSPADAKKLLEGGIGCSGTNAKAAWWLIVLLLPLFWLRKNPRDFKVMAILPLLLFSLAACDSGSAGTPCKDNSDCSVGQICQGGVCVTGSIECMSDDDCNRCDMCQAGQCVPRADECACSEDEPECWDGYVCDTEQGICVVDEGGNDCTDGECPCTDGECPPCYYCSQASDTCKLQLCDPECPNPEELGILTCPEQKEFNGEPDTCAECVVREGRPNECKPPQCETDEDCSCRVCPEGDPPAVCSSTKECVCRKPCGGVCPGSEEGVGGCCLPSNTCYLCAGWCEGVECPPWQEAGGCDPTDTDECNEPPYNLPRWTLCDNFDTETCTYSGPGSPDHSTCACQDKPPLDVGKVGRFHSVASYQTEVNGNPVNRLFFASYNSTYGDLVVADVMRNQAMFGEIDDEDWVFLDGIPDETPTAQPTGPRGGVRQEGDDVGRYTSVAVTSEGHPRIVYQDVENGDLVIMWHDGPEAVVEPDGDVDEEAEDEIAEDAEGEEDGTSARNARDDEEMQIVWKRMVLDSAGDTGYYNKIYLDEQDRPIVLYTTATTSDGKYSQLKIAMATTANLTLNSVKDDWIIGVLDEVRIAGEPCIGVEGGCEGEGETCVWDYALDDDRCVTRSEITDTCTPECEEGVAECVGGFCLPIRTATGSSGLVRGTGIRPQMTIFPDVQPMTYGKVWITYYHNDSFTAGQWKEHGNLMRIRLNQMITPEMLAEAIDEGARSVGWTPQVILGTPEAWADGDIGRFYSMDVANTGAFVVSFYNADLNRVGIWFDMNLGNGLEAYYMDDGFRRDENDDFYRAKVGADTQVRLVAGEIMLAYQNQTDGQLLLKSFGGIGLDGYNPNLYDCNVQDNPCTVPLRFYPEVVLGGTPVHDDHGHNHGFFINFTKVDDGASSILSSYYVHLNDQTIEEEGDVIEDHEFKVKLFIP